jgi:hypothetical protein
MALVAPSGKGIEKVIKRFCVETCVYWGNPQNDGFGGFTFDTPVELKCRWEEKAQVDIGWFSTGFPSNVFISKASVLVLYDLDLQGYLWLGTLAQLNALGYDTSKPITIPQAYIIHRVDKIPFVRKTDEFVRTVWLYEQGK